MLNKDNLSFIELFKQIYLVGIEFAIKYPKYVKIMEKLLMSKNNVYKEFFNSQVEIVLNYYISFIENDKKLGRINEEIDTKTLAELVLNMTTNITIEEIYSGNNEMNFKVMIEKVDKIMFIFEKGITRGEKDV